MNPAQWSQTVIGFGMPCKNIDLCHKCVLISERQGLTFVGSSFSALCYVGLSAILFKTRTITLATARLHAEMCKSADSIKKQSVVIQRFA